MTFLIRHGSRRNGSEYLTSWVIEALPASFQSPTLRVVQQFSLSLRHLCQGVMAYFVNNLSPVFVIWDSLTSNEPRPSASRRLELACCELRLMQRRWEYDGIFSLSLLPASCLENLIPTLLPVAQDSVVSMALVQSTQKDVFDDGLLRETNGSPNSDTYIAFCVLTSVRVYFCEQTFLAFSERSNTILAQNLLFMENITKISKTRIHSQLLMIS